MHDEDMFHRRGKRRERRRRNRLTERRGDRAHFVVAHDHFVARADAADRKARAELDSSRCACPADWRSIQHENIANDSRARTTGHARPDLIIR